MSNTTTRVPNLATVRKALAAAGRTPAEDTPKALKAAWLDLQANPPVEATPAAEPAKPTPAEVKPAATQPANFPLCGCGCKVPTVTAKATFLSGHDARLAGDLGRALAATPNDANLQARRDALSPSLRAKVDQVAATALRKAAEKAARAAAKEAAKAAYAAALNA